MGTGVDHLQRRGSLYRWLRRLPHAPALRPDHCISRSLDTADPDLPRRRARACSAYFDVALMRLMSNGIPPTRKELAHVLDDVFRRVLDDGERNRAERKAGAPDWIPEPQTDLRYEGPGPRGPGQHAALARALRKGVAGSGAAQSPVRCRAAGGGRI